MSSSDAPSGAATLASLGSGVSARWPARRFTVNLRNAIALVAMIPIFGTSAVLAQSDLDRARNLVTCYTGTLPTLCKRQWLNSEERGKADEAEHRENLKMCLNGTYPSLCLKSKLTPDELAQVESAEKAVNLRICASGRTPSLCRHSLLTEDQRREIAVVEERVRASNLSASRNFYLPPDTRPSGGDAYGGGRSGGCGSRGGPGWRKANGKCASWRD